eukprot:2726075-Rhodomonas_salina.1
MLGPIGNESTTGPSWSVAFAFSATSSSACSCSRVESVAHRVVFCSGVGSAMRSGGQQRRAASQRVRLSQLTARVEEKKKKNDEGKKHARVAFASCVWS